MASRVVSLPAFCALWFFHFRFVPLLAPDTYSHNRYRRTFERFRRLTVRRKPRTYDGNQIARLRVFSSLRFAGPAERLQMNRHDPIGYLVWGGLTYGLTKAVMDIAAWFGVHIGGIEKGLLYILMLFVAAGLVLHILLDSSEEG
jgi:hypothetical protein